MKKSLYHKMREPPLRPLSQVREGDMYFLHSSIPSSVVLFISIAMFTISICRSILFSAVFFLMPSVLSQCI